MRLLPCGGRRRHAGSAKRGLMTEAFRRAWRSTVDRLSVTFRLLWGHTRSRLDYLVFLLRYRKSFARVGAWAAVAVISFIGGWKGDIDWLTGLGVVSTIGALFDVGVQYREVRGHALPPRAVHYEQYPVSPGMQRVVLEREQGENDHGFVATSELLRSSGLARDSARETVGQWNAGEYEMPPEFRSIAAAVLFSHYRRQNVPHFNGRIVRQTSDVDSSGTVSVAPARYFDLLCTNYLTGRMVRDPHDKCLVVGADWMERMANGGATVRDVADSPLANGIGISSLAFTADSPRRLIVVKQSYRSASSPGLWAPSSSGSMEERDIRVEDSSFSFVDAVVDAMQRELVEESNVEPHQILDTRVLGYFRWLNKGAKPEYVGVTLLNTRLADLQLRPRRIEKPWVVRVAEAGALDVAAIERGDVLGALSEDIRGLMLDDHDSLRDAASFPLFVSLRLLAEQLRTDQQFRDWLGDL
jgi:hypothetical protein